MPKISIEMGNQEDLTELQMCAHEFIDFVDDFELNLRKEKYFILTAYYLKNLSGILLAEKQISKTDKLDTIIPKIRLIFIFVNPTYRSKFIAEKLLNSFIKIQRKRQVASVFIKLPRKYKKGKKYLKKHHFTQINTSKNEVTLERHLWYDFGLCLCDFIDDEIYNVLN
jgi:hypothetical protein